MKTLKVVSIVVAVFGLQMIEAARYSTKRGHPRGERPSVQGGSRTQTAYGTVRTYAPATPPAAAAPGQVRTTPVGVAASGQGRIGTAVSTAPGQVRTTPVGVGAPGQGRIGTAVSTAPGQVRATQVGVAPGQGRIGTAVSTGPGQVRTTPIGAAAPGQRRIGTAVAASNLARRGGRYSGQNVRGSFYRRGQEGRGWESRRADRKSVV